MLFLVSALQPQQPPTRAVVVAARDLAAGVPLSRADVELASWPAQLPSGSAFGSIDDAIGRPTTGPLLAGEPLGPTRVLGPDFMKIGVAPNQVELVASPVRLADAAETGLLRPGDIVDVIASAEDTAAQTVASGARVILVPGEATATDSGFLGGSSSGSIDAGSLVVLAVTPDTAIQLAAASADRRLSIVVRGAS